VLEIIALMVLMGRIGDMARRRGRHPALFSLLLLVCWFGGEVAGAVLGYVLSNPGGTAQPDTPLIYGLALLGAAVGAVAAFLVARSFSPVDGVWREPDALPIRRSRLRGAVVGGVCGGVIGAVVIAVIYGVQEVKANLPMMALGCLAMACVGALLGLVSGLQKE
jgi:hypothetical protein